MAFQMSGPNCTCSTCSGLLKAGRAKPNANKRTLRPDKCLVVPSLSPALRPGCSRDTGANAVTTSAGLEQPPQIGNLLCLSRVKWSFDG